MRLRKFIPPVSILLFLALTAAGTYYVRLTILERHMADALEVRDDDNICTLIYSFPCPASARNREGRTPLHWACEKGDLGAVKRLLSRCAGVNAREGFRLPVWELRASNPTGRMDLRRTDRTVKGRTPLHLAAASGRRDIAEILVDSCANVMAADGDGITPLHLAASRSVAEFLIAKGADINARTSDGRTPLLMAVNNARTDVAAHLIAKGAEVNAATKLGWTPLHLAAQQGFTELVELLIAAGGDIEARGKPGMRPLHLAALWGQRNVVEFLLSKGADLRAAGGGGSTALRWAMDEGRDDIADILRKAGAKE